MNKLSKRLFVCYIPGLDLRRITVERAPYIAELLNTYPWAALRGYPSPELLSTVMTGQEPHEHGIWQTTLRPRKPQPVFQRVLDRLPDAITIPAQCIQHQLFRNCDIPTIPPRRRRRFALSRLKFYGHADTQKLLARLGPIESLVTALGAERCRYVFNDRFNEREQVVHDVASGGWTLEFLQFHAADILGHWHADTPEKISALYRAIDDFVQRLHEKCQANGVLMSLCSDHGQEPVTGSIDLRRHLTALAVPDGEYAYFLQPIAARFWFETDRARQTVTGMLSNVAHGMLLSYRDMHEHGVRFPDGRNGEWYFLADPGYLFFPHDFYHPLPNLLFGLKDWQQRRRIRDPRHIAYHGYLPSHPSERGFVAVLDARCRTDGGTIALTDLAPSWLALAGERAPTSMRGTARFRGAD